MNDPDWAQLNADRPSNAELDEKYLRLRATGRNVEAGFIELVKLALPENAPRIQYEMMLVAYACGAGDMVKILGNAKRAGDRTALRRAVEEIEELTTLTNMNSTEEQVQ